MSFINNPMQTNAFSMGHFVWWVGVVEDRNDPEKLGRLRVRVYGYHTDEGEVYDKYYKGTYIVSHICQVITAGEITVNMELVKKRLEERMV